MNDVINTSHSGFNQFHTDLFHFLYNTVAVIEFLNTSKVICVTKLCKGNRTVMKLLLMTSPKLCDMKGIR